MSVKTGNVYHCQQFVRSGQLEKIDEMVRNMPRLSVDPTLFEEIFNIAKKYNKLEEIKPLFKAWVDDNIPFSYFYAGEIYRELDDLDMIGFYRKSLNKLYKKEECYSRLKECLVNRSETASVIGKIMIEEGQMSLICKELELLVLKNGHQESLDLLVKYYRSNGNKTVELFKAAIDAGNKKAYLLLGDYFDSDISEHYYLEGVKNGVHDCTERLIAKYQKMERWTKIIELSSIVLGTDNDDILNEYIVNVDNIMSYLMKDFIMEDTIKMVQKIGEDKFQNYLKVKNEEDRRLMFQKNQQLSKYMKLKEEYKKMRDNYETQYTNLPINECCICYNDTKMALMVCKHPVCLKCYPNISKCPLCREDLNPNKEQWKVPSQNMYRNWHRFVDLFT